MTLQRDSALGDDKVRTFFASAGGRLDERESKGDVLAGGGDSGLSVRRGHLLSMSRI